MRALLGACDDVLKMAVYEPRAFWVFSAKTYLNVTVVTRAGAFSESADVFRILQSWCASSGASCVGPDERTPLFTDTNKTGLAPVTALASDPHGPGLFQVRHSFLAGECLE
jgi:hypothetical protein